MLREISEEISAVKEVELLKIVEKKISETINILKKWLEQRLKSSLSSILKNFFNKEEYFWDMSRVPSITYTSKNLAKPFVKNYQVDYFQGSLEDG